MSRVLVSGFTGSCKDSRGVYGFLAGFCGSKSKSLRFLV